LAIALNLLGEAEIQDLLGILRTEINLKPLDKGRYAIEIETPDSPGIVHQVLGNLEGFQVIEAVSQTTTQHRGVSPAKLRFVVRPIPRAERKGTAGAPQPNVGGLKRALESHHAAEAATRKLTPPVTARLKLRFVASPGLSHWESLHQIVEILEADQMNILNLRLPNISNGGENRVGVVLFEYRGEKAFTLGQLADMKEMIATIAARTKFSLRAIS